MTTDPAVARGGLVWTFVGFAASGVAGLLLNILIEDAFGTEELGRFSTLLAVLLIGGQVGVIGLHSSVLYHTPAARSLGQRTGQVLVTALRLVAVSSLANIFVIVGGGQLLLRLVGNESYLHGLLVMAPGLYLYAVNKVLVAHLNGLRRIRAVAVTNALRFVGLVAAVAVVVSADLGVDALPWSITITEVLLTLLLVALLRGELTGDARTIDPDLANRQIRFGLRGMTGGLLLDLNTRVDVLSLSILAGASEVGTYVIAAVFGEGLYQLAMVTRFSYDPLIASLSVEGRHDELRDLLRTARRRIYVGITAVGVVTALVYPFVVTLLFDRDIAWDTWSIYLLLATGVVVTSGYIPFTGLLQQLGDPTRHSMLLGLVSATNVVCNIALVPFFGAQGAAAATALAQISMVPYLRTLARRHLGQPL